MRGGWVYIMTNRPNGTLYTAVTADLARRAYEHRDGLCVGFTSGMRSGGWRGMNFMRTSQQRSSVRAT